MADWTSPSSASWVTERKSDSKWCSKALWVRARGAGLPLRVLEPANSVEGSSLAGIRTRILMLRGWWRPVRTLSRGSCMASCMASAVMPKKSTVTSSASNARSSWERSLTGGSTDHDDVRVGGPMSLDACQCFLPYFDLGQEQRPYRLGEAARQPEPLRCRPRKTRPHGIPPVVVKRALSGSSDRRACL